MTRQEIDRIRFVTGHFRELQGLRTVLFAGWCLIMVCHGFLPWSQNVVIPLSFLTFIPYHFLSRRVDRYYRERFGVVETRPARSPRLDYRITAILIVAALVLVTAAKRWIPAWIYGEFYYEAAGATLIGRWLWLGRPSVLAHRALLGAFLLALGPLTTFVAPVWKSTEFLVFILILTLKGLLDHRQLELAMAQRRGALLAEVEQAAEVER